MKKIMHYKFIILVVCLSLGIPLSAQKLSKKKAKLLMKDVKFVNCYNDYKTITYPVFTGNTSSSFVKKTKVIVELSSTFYTVTVNNDNRYSNGNYRPQIEREHTPAKISNKMIVTDTTAERRFQMETFYSRKMVPVKDDVSLAADLDLMSISKFAKLLKSKGYQISDSMDIHSAEFDRALFQYQKDNGLCIGNLTEATYRHLESESPNPVVNENFMTGTVYLSESKYPVDHRKVNQEFRESIKNDSVYVSSLLETIKFDSLKY